MGRRLASRPEVVPFRREGRGWLRAVPCTARRDAHRGQAAEGLGAGVFEVLADHRGDTFRAVYTVHLAGRVYVLHAFQKKSKHGTATPQPEIDMIKRRLKQAIAISEGKE
jgi:phage-related protein